MRFKEIFDVIILGTDGVPYSLDNFDSYEAAYDAAILKASEELPKETVRRFSIVKRFVNLSTGG